jgi:hypothetical protein
VEPDGLTFDQNTVRGERIKEDADYEGVRVRLRGVLGKAIIPVQIDIVFGDVVTPAPILLQYPTILPMPLLQIRGYPPESVVAEKLHALVFLGSVNSRMKDFYDLWVIAEAFEFDGGRLQDAIINTFQRRKTVLPINTPIGLTDLFAADKQSQWQAFLKCNRLVGVPESLQQILRGLNSFLLPSMLTSSQGIVFEGEWKSGGSWI